MERRGVKPFSDTEVVYFQGARFCRRPGKRYFKGVSFIDGKYVFDFLHRAVWRHHNGPIPKGRHVHHKDEDPDNNDIDNLELLAVRYHAARHKGHWGGSKKHKDRSLAKARKAASKWIEEHKHDPGYQSQCRRRAALMHESIRKNPKKRMSCVGCGKEFEYEDWGKVRKYCGPKCKQRQRDRSVQSVCGWCQETFTGYDARTECCSNSCAARLRWHRRRRTDPGL